VHQQMHSGEHQYPCVT